MTKNLKLKLFFFVLLFIVNLPNSYSAILDDWKNPEAYKPNPVLFLHGFGRGNPHEWDYIKSQINQYFSDYSSSLSFLEAINFNDPNGSIDSYSDGRDGWADKIKNKVNELLEIYKFKGKSLQINFICFSMGGLAAREYLTNDARYGNAYFNVSRLVTIGTPHAGTSIANVKKIEDALTGEHKYVWEVPGADRCYTIASSSSDVLTLQLIKGELKLDPDGEAVKDMAIKSDFLNSLNSKSQPSGFKNYALYGEAKSMVSMLLNNIFFALYYPDEPFTCGDGIVPRDSQIGIDIMSNYPDTAPKQIWNFDVVKKIPAGHFDELTYEGTPGELLFFLDPAPVLEFISPDPIGTTEIYESSIHIQGKVYKEYLPADSQLVMSITRQDDGYIFPMQTSMLKPSDLWIPGNPDSPVAEFDEVINFSGAGTYKISCQVKNPAGISSGFKDVWVKVNVSEGTNIIVHCHNPEDKEIAGIKGVAPDSVKIFDGDSYVGYGAYDAASHNRPIAIDPGQHTFKAKFNGITKEQTVTLNPNQTKSIIFVFERTEFDFSSMINNLGIEMTISDGGEVPYDWSGTPAIAYSRQYPGQENFWFSVHSKKSDPAFASESMTGNFTIAGNFRYTGSLMNISLDTTLDTQIKWYKDRSVFMISQLLLTDASGSPNNNGSSPSLSFPITVWPTNTNFNLWYLQHLFTGDHPRLMLFISGETNPIYLSYVEFKKTNYYTCRPISSRFIIESMKIDFGDYYPAGLQSSCGGYIDASDPSSFHNLLVLSCTQTYKMSSIPYDFTGSGI